MKEARIKKSQEKSLHVVALRLDEDLYQKLEEERKKRFPWIKSVGPFIMQCVCATLFAKEDKEETF